MKRLSPKAGVVVLAALAFAAAAAVAPVVEASEAFLRREVARAGRGRLRRV